MIKSRLKLPQRSLQIPPKDQSNFVASSGTSQLGIGIVALFVLVTIGLVFWGFLVVCRAQQMNDDDYDDQSDVKGGERSLEKQTGHFRGP